MPFANTTTTRPWAIRGADGTIVYEGLGLEPPYDAKNTGSATIGRGEACTLEAGADTSLGRWDLTSSDVTFATELVLGVERVDAAADVGFVGVAKENIPALSTGRVAGAGAIIPVKCLVAPTSNVVGNAVIGSATAGSVDSIATAPTKGTVLGEQVILAGVAAGQSGSTTQLVVLICPR